MEVNFKNSKSLGDFILKVQKKEDKFLEHFDSDKFKIDFPHFMISILRKLKMASKKHTVKAWEHNDSKGQNVAYQNQQQFPVNQMAFIPQMMHGMYQMQFQPVPIPVPVLNAPKKKFGTVDELARDKAEFLKLPDAEKNVIFRALITEKLKNYSKLVDL